MNEISIRDDTEVEGKTGRKIAKRREMHTPTDKLLLQQHASLLVKDIASATTFRAINVLLILIATICPWFPIDPGRVFGTLLLTSIIVAVLWYKERGVIVIRVDLIEKTLGKKSRFEFEGIFVHYKFTRASEDPHWILRSEPLLWIFPIIFPIIVGFLQR